MPNSHNIQCACGHIRGLLTSTTPSNRCVCYCEDRQAFAQHFDAGMLRWYAACCNTPIGNTPLTPRVSFVGLIHSCLVGDAPSRQASFGPVTMVVGVKSALGNDKPRSAGLVSGIAKTMAMIIKARLSGAYRRSPFFNPDTGAPVVKPMVLTAAELAAAKSATR